jgi:hypothetical protein
MKYLEEYRDSSAVQEYIRLIKDTFNHPRTLMEISGVDTHDCQIWDG